MPNEKKLRRWMNQMCVEIPGVLTEAGFERRSCILHTRLAVMRARKDGIRARALACRVEVLNPEWIALRDRLGREPTSAEWTANPQAWSMGIGFGAGEVPLATLDARRRDGYDAHVVTVVEERHVLDLTIDQANRPQKNIKLRPGFFDASPAFLAGEVGIGYVQNGCEVRYMPIPDERGYLTVPDWTEVRANDPVVRRILAA
jgi:hypothetical protein